MSYILNALRKSERERQLNQAQNLAKHLQAPKPGNSGIHTRWLVLLVILNAALLASVLIKKDGGETSRPAPSPNHKQPAVIAEKIPLEPNITRPLTENSAEPVAEPQAAPGPETIVGLIKDKNSRKIEATPDAAQNNTGIKQKPSAEQSAAPASLVAKTTRNKTQRSHDSAADAPFKHEATLNPLATIEIVPDSNEFLVKREINGKIEKSENNIPWLEELPASFRRNVPELDINVYVYSDQAENRFIMVSMHKYLSGQELGPGMLLKDILQDGIVVEYRGRQFKIRRD